MSEADDRGPVRSAPFSPSPLGVAIDMLSDIAVLAFAVWTLLAYLSMLVGLPTWPIVIAWFVSLPVLTIGRWRVGARSEPDPPADKDIEPARTGAWPMLAVALIIALAAAVIGGERQLHWFALAWLCGLATVALALWVQFRGQSTPSLPSRRLVAPAAGASWLADGIAAVVALGSGGLSVFVLRFNPDDVFYINRASVVAALGHIPTRDVLLSYGHFKPLEGTGSPVDAIAPLEGALARLFGAHATTLAYLVEPPVAVALGVWALWRLVRRWAPRRALLCFLLGVLYLYESGSGHLSFGDFFLTRIQEGKVVFVTCMLPTLFVYLTDWARHGRRVTGVLIAASCVASLGLTSSATFDVPLVVGAGVLPLLVSRRWSALTVPAAAAAFPFVVGTICSRLAPVSAVQSASVRLPHMAYGAVFGIGLIAVIGGLALWLGPWLVRDRTAQLMVLGAVLIATAILAPKVMFEVHNVTNLGGALQRILWVVPLPTLVGLLAAYPPVGVLRRPGSATAGVSHRAGLATLAIPVLIAVLLLVDGAPITSYSRTMVLSHPTLRIPDVSTARANAVLRHVRAGIVLAPLTTMSVIAIESGTVKAVDPRTLYTKEIPQPGSLLADRLRLDRMVKSGMKGLSLPKLKTALRQLHVGTVCVPTSHQSSLAFLRHAGYLSAFSTPSALECLQNNSTPGP